MSRARVRTWAQLALVVLIGGFFGAAVTTKTYPSTLGFTVGALIAVVVYTMALTALRRRVRH